MARSYAGPSESPRERERDPGDAGRVTVSEFLFLAIGLVLGVASGAALIEIIRNSLGLLGINAFWQGCFIGGAILLAVSFERVRNFRQNDE